MRTKRSWFTLCSTASDYKEAPLARYVTVGSVSQYPKGADSAARHEEAAALLQRAARLGAQIVAFPETYHHTGLAGTAEDHAQTLDGPSVSRMAQEARRNGVHVVWPLYTREHGRIYNSAVLVGPAGDIAGVYHKMFPTIGEIESGITPGERPAVFETDLGRFGTVICFDLNFDEVMQGTADAGAEVVFFCSAYRGGLQLGIWAYLTGAYIVSAVLAELGQIVDLSGQVLAESTYEGVITRRINLDRRLMHMDCNWDKMDALLAKYGPKVSIDFFTREACWAVGSESDEFTVDALMQEFGLESRSGYFQRARHVRQQALQRRC
jgi:predicted amidohydrolase